MGIENVSYSKFRGKHLEKMLVKQNTGNNDWELSR